MIYIGICDDELIHQSKNQACCEHFFSTNKLDHTYIFFHSINDVVSYCSHHISVLLLDIEMNDSINGVQLMRRLQHNQFIISIIFVSNHTHYIYDSFSPKTIGFCPKPLETERLFPLLESALRNHCSEPIVFDNTPKGYIYTDDIIYIYSTGHYINVVTYSSGTHLFVMDIKNAEIILQNTNIIRIHRSYMINMACIKDINYTDITLSADIIEIRHLPIGRSYRQKVKSLYTKYLLN